MRRIVKLGIDLVLDVEHPGLGVAEERPLVFDLDRRLPFRCERFRQRDDDVVHLQFRIVVEGDDVLVNLPPFVTFISR